MRAIVLLLMVLAAAGCSLITPKLEPPQLSIAAVQLLKSNLFEQQLRVRMHVQNPNDRALPVQSLSYTLEVAGEQLAAGQSDAAFTVPALGETEFDMSMTVNMTATLIKLAARGSDSLSAPIDYHLLGRVTLSEGLLRSIPFDQRGTFKLQ